MNRYAGWWGAFPPSFGAAPISDWVRFRSMPPGNLLRFWRAARGREAPASEQNEIRRLYYEAIDRDGGIGAARVDRIPGVVVRQGAEPTSPELPNAGAVNGARVVILERGLAPWDQSYGEWWKIRTPNGTTGYVLATDGHGAFGGLTQISTIDRVYVPYTNP